MLKNLDCLVNSDFFLIFANEINKQKELDYEENIMAYYLPYDNGCEC